MEINTPQIFEGLQPQTYDHRDLKLSGFVKLPALETLPNSFIVADPYEKDQTKYPDYCTACASCSASEPQEGVPLLWQWAFAAGKSIEGKGDVTKGLQIRDICEVHVTWGVPELTDVSPDFLKKPDAFLRKIGNWPIYLYEKAKVHKKASYVDVDGPYDHYDNIRATLYFFRKEKRLIISGLLWNWPLSQIKLENIPTKGTGHCICYTGYVTKEGIYTLNSYGKKAGDNGYHFVSRETINHFVEIYGAKMFVDMPKEDIEWYTENNIKVNDSAILSLLKQFLNLLKIFKKIK